MVEIMQVMSIRKISTLKMFLFRATITLVLVSLFLGHPMAYEKQLEKNVWAKFGKDRDISLIKEIGER